MNYKLLKAIYSTILFSITAAFGIAQNTTKRTAQDLIKIADSLYFAQDWKNAKKIYETVLGDTSHNSIAWNRLGFSNYNLGNNDEALKGFQKSLAFNPIPPVKASALSTYGESTCIEK